MKALLLRGVRSSPAPRLLQQWVRGLNASSGTAEPAAPQPVALSKLKDSFNDATSGTQKSSVLSASLSITRASEPPLSLSSIHRAGINAVSYLEELEKKFHEDPTSIDRTWASFFANLGEAGRGLQRRGLSSIWVGGFKLPGSLQTVASRARRSLRPMTPLRRARFRRRWHRPRFLPRLFRRACASS